MKNLNFERGMFVKKCFPVYVLVIDRLCHNRKFPITDYPSTNLLNAIYIYIYVVLSTIIEYILHTFIVLQRVVIVQKYRSKFHINQY